MVMLSKTPSANPSVATTSKVRPACAHHTAVARLAVLVVPARRASLLSRRSKMGAVAYRQSEAELNERLREQVGFLRASARVYDDGHDAEAQRLAVTTRILCYDKRRQQSLLGQLGILDTLRFLDTAPPPLETLPGATEGVPDGVMWTTVFKGLAPMAGGPRGYLAKLGGATSAARLRFEEWWNAPALEGPGLVFPRRGVVLALANKEGGAHVDPDLDADYAAVSRQHALGTISYTTPDGKTHVVDANPFYPVMRQIAYELESTLSEVASPELGGRQQE
jgi:hypothetical protein